VEGLSCSIGDAASSQQLWDNLTSQGRKEEMVIGARIKVKKKKKVWSVLCETKLHVRKVRRKWEKMQATLSGAV